MKRKGESDKKKKKKKMKKQAQSSSQASETTNVKAKIINTIQDLAEVMNKRFDQVNSETRVLRNIVGLVNERSLRVEIRRIFGESFAEGTVIQSLADVALMLSKRVSGLDSIQFFDVIDKLAKFAEVNILKFIYDIGGKDLVTLNEQKEYTKNNIKFPDTKKKRRKLKLLPPQKMTKEEINRLMILIVTWWNEEQPEQQRRILISAGGFAVPLLCWLSYEKFEFELEFDYCGSIVIHRLEHSIQVHVSIGEGKTLKGIEHTQRQLIKRLRFIQTACSIIYPNPTFILDGHIFLLKREKKTKVSNVVDDINFFVHLV